MATPPRPDPAPQAAEAYARLRLRQLVMAHLLAGMPTPGEGGLAAVWRGLSGSLGAPAAAAGFQDPGFWLRQGAPGPGPVPLATDHGPLAGPPPPSAPSGLLGAGPDMVGQQHGLPANPLPVLAQLQRAAPQPYQGAIQQLATMIAGLVRQGGQGQGGGFQMAPQRFQAR